MVKKISLFFLLSILIQPIFSQELKEMEIERVPESEESSVIVRNPNEAILIVHSKILVLNFESNISIIGVDNPYQGEYRVHLHPGTNLITFKSDGYKPIINERFHIPKKEYKEVKIRSKEQIILNYQNLRLQKKKQWKQRKYISLASSIALAGASAILFVKANDNYKKYQNASTVANVQNYRESTETMRLMSQISFGVSVSSLFYSIYSYFEEKKCGKMG